MATKTPAERYQFRVYIPKGSLLFPVVDGLSTDQQRRDALIALATSQLVRQLPSVRNGLLEFLEPSGGFPVAAGGVHPSAMPLATESRAITATERNDGDGSSGPDAPGFSHLDPSVALQFG